VLSCLLGNAQNLEFIADAEFMKDLFRYEMFVAGFDIKSLFVLFVYRRILK
jgi:hypothetical protein